MTEQNKGLPFELSAISLGIPNNIFFAFKRIKFFQLDNSVDCAVARTVMFIPVPLFSLVKDKTDEIRNEFIDIYISIFKEFCNLSVCQAAIYLAEQKTKIKLTKEDASNKIPVLSSELSKFLHKNINEAKYWLSDKGHLSISFIAEIVSFDKIESSIEYKIALRVYKKHNNGITSEVVETIEL